MLIVKTDNRERELLYLDELPRGEERAEFSEYVSGESGPVIFKYKGQYRCTFDFICIEDERLTDKGWQGMQHDTAWSGVVIKYGDEGGIIVGTCMEASQSYLDAIN